jgi:hypothetical protein
MLFVDFHILRAKPGLQQSIAEYSNYDRVEFSTDESWLTTDMYTNPSLHEFIIVLKTNSRGSPDFAKMVKHPSFGEWI